MSREIADALQRGLARLAAAETQIPVLADLPVENARFRRLGRWLIEEHLLISLLCRRALRRPSAVPTRLARAGMGQLLRALLLSPRWRSNCRAQAVFVKTHLRAFYLKSEPLTLKLVAPDAREAVAGDVRARASATHLCGPRLLAHRCDGPDPYLCEELILGRHPDPVRDAPAVVALVLGGLWDRFREHGFTWRSCADSHDLAALVSNFETMTDALAWPERNVVREQLSSLSKEDARLVPWCLGHGDLSVGNMLMGDDGIVLIDWERSGRLPLFVELAKIVVTCPGAWNDVSAHVRDAFTEIPPPGMASPEVLGALASLERLVALRTRFSVASPRQSPRGIEARRFRRRLDAELAHLAKLMACHSA